MPLAARVADPGDVDELLRLDAEVFGAFAYPPSVVRQLLDISPDLVLLAGDGDGGRPALGFAFGALAAGRTTAWILSLGVGAAHRRQGVGRTLALSLLERLDRLGATRTRLTVAPDEPVALAFYDGLGFAPTGLVEGYLGPGRDRLVLERPSIRR